MMNSGLTSKRHEGKPLRQPLYEMRDVLRCSKDLKGSSIYEVTKREHFVDAMAEMILLSKEAVRRSKRRQSFGKFSSKPLSVEYMADRLDIDDPLFGYIVRDAKSRMQGFITFTTFTNWQKAFRWDSMHACAFAYDQDALATQMLEGERRFDKNGTFSRELQSTVWCGDPWNEGIVWPRVAEISLLGGLGCGKALLSLAIEKLELMKATKIFNYDYVVLQATDNSVSFYESMGFVRVGTMVEDKNFEQKMNKRRRGTGEDDTESEDDSKDVSKKPASNDSEEKSEFVSSPTIPYEVKTAGETPHEIAKRFGVDVWDVVFLNRFVYPELGPKSRLKCLTALNIPAKTLMRFDAATHAFSEMDLEGEKSSVPKWYTARENDTPRMIAKLFQVSCSQLVRANQERLPELQAISRLKEGTRIKVSRFDLHDDKHIPYSHWTFPDDPQELVDPSYMMARKLNRRQGPPKSSLSRLVKKYVAPPESMFSVSDRTIRSAVRPKRRQKKQLKNKRVTEPVRPKRPISRYMIFCLEERSSLKALVAGKSAAEYNKVLAEKWKELSTEEQDAYGRKFEQARADYEEAMEKYNEDLERFYKQNPDKRPESDDDEGDPMTMVNKVVRLKAGAGGKGCEDFEYFYVLTYIPDLHWCHLAPMRSVGRWGPERPKAGGRLIWVLVGEEEGKEVDISASFCIPVRSRAMLKTVDADVEKWDIFESGDSSVSVETTSDRLRGAKSAGDDMNESTGGRTLQTTQREPRSATKPLTGTVEIRRKRPLEETVLDSQDSDETNSDSTTIELDDYCGPVQHKTRSTPTKLKKPKLSDEAVWGHDRPLLRAASSNSQGSPTKVLPNRKSIIATSGQKNRNVGSNPLVQGHRRGGMSS